MWTPKKKEWQEADLGSHTAQQGLKPTNFEFLASGSACQSTIHVDVHGWLGASCDGAWLYLICSDSPFWEATVERAWTLHLPPRHMGKPHRRRQAPEAKCNFRNHNPQGPSRLCGFSMLCLIIQVSTGAPISSGESETQVGILAEHAHLRTSSVSPNSVLHKREPRPLHWGQCSDISKPNSSSVWLNKDTCTTVTRAPYLWKAHTSMKMANRYPFSLGCERSV